MKKDDALNLPKGWEIKRLDDLCQIELGKTPYRADKSFWDNEKKTQNVWLSIADLLNTDGDVVSDSKEYITDKAAKISKVVKKGTLLLSFKLTLGRLAFAGRDLYTNEAIAALSIKDEKVIDKYFLYHFLSFYDWNAATETDIKVKGKTLNKAKLKEIEIPLPPLPEQQRIVSILDECFSVIERSRNNAEQNLKNTKELFESYLNGVFEKKGEGWEEKRIDEICKLINGRAYKKDELLNKGKYRVLRVGNFFTSDHWYYSDLELDEDKYCDKEDLLYAWSASFGPRIWKEEKVIYHYHIWKVIPDENKVTRDFLFTLFEWDKEKIKAAQGTGTTMIHVSKGSMENRIVPVPPLKEQQTIVRQLDALRAETQKLEAVYQKKIADLEELKKSILQKAFAGELRGGEPAEPKTDKIPKG